jgi:superfamily II DNA or RNA helicase
MNRRKFFFKKSATSKKPPPPPIYVPSDEYKTIICNNAYLGKKGYTIPKSLLEKDDEEFLRRDLFVKPEVHGANFGGAPEATPFPVFRENVNKMYLPRFYGIQRYGVPHRSEIQSGDDINVTFDKPLRDYQNKVIDFYLNYVNTQLCSSGVKSVEPRSGSELFLDPFHRISKADSEKDESNIAVGNGGIIELPCGFGKTICALKIISLLKKKTLIIVHKEFLMNQWIERIEEFLTGAKIGKIQGPVFDVEGKDIVIGMVQTLYDKEYPPDAFSSFGLTIIDEVHRIGSEQFSKTLFKTITPYMLGISATVERKDKLTKVLYMFIGEKIYSIKRDADDTVNVRGIHYKSNDTEFNETEVDFRGMPKYSTMITKLCEYGPRSDFIIRVISDLVNENNSSQIMVLCHNRSLLTYLYDGIVHRGFATVGYYVGGMKQDKLQQTESKQIVLATYAMAAEALDIKTLSTLVMITPKTDITQSVGRILRMKHENPIIVDIIDNHDLFKNQWNQRKRFYKKNSYRIMEIDSTKYKNMEIDDLWKKTYEPKEKSNVPDETDEPQHLNPIGKCVIDTSMFTS